MYYRVTRLKRFKLLKLILNITSFPIRFPIFLSFIIIGKVAEILAIILGTIVLFIIIRALIICIF